MVGLLFFLLLTICILVWLNMRPGCLRHHRHRPVQDAATVPCPIRSRRKPPWVAREIVRLKARSPEFGCRAIADAFNRRFAERGVSVGKTYVATLLKRRRADHDDLHGKLVAFGCWHNHTRPHQHLHVCTPTEAGAGGMTSEHSRDISQEVRRNVLSEGGKRLPTLQRNRLLRASGRRLEMLSGRSRRAFQKTSVSAVGSGCGQHGRDSVTGGGHAGSASSLAGGTRACGCGTCGCGAAAFHR